MTQQQGDVVLYQTPDDGDISVSDGVVRMDGGLQTAVYLSLFGGNITDPGDGNTAQQWWGNIGETDVYRSETQYLLRSIPPIPANLLRVEDAAARDLAWMVTAGAATAVSVSASMPGLNRVSIVVDITADGTSEQLIFLENWEASR